MTDVDESLAPQLHVDNTEGISKERGTNKILHLGSVHVNKNRQHNFVSNVVLKSTTQFAVWLCFVHNLS